jgi:hypothetical protein
MLAECMVGWERASRREEGEEERKEKMKKALGKAG